MMTLRLVTQRLSSTPAWQLPHIAPYLARSICENGWLFSDQSNTVSADVTVLVHKLKTQISTLLQDNSIHARWAALVLAKAIIVSGGHEVLQGIDPWVRSMITILGKPDPPSTKKLCITNLTSVFLFTHGHQPLSKEITKTPVLPASMTECFKTFVPECHRIISSSSNQSLSLITVQALVQLLPHHPSSFRPFISQIRHSILPLIAPTPSSRSPEPSRGQAKVTENLANSSRRLYALLSTCAPKKTENEDWTKSLRFIVDTTHTTADLVLRSLVEDPKSTFRVRQSVIQSPTERIRYVKKDLQDLPDWDGIEAGIERLEGLLKTLRAFTSTATRFSVSVQVGIVLDVIFRILSLLAPSKLSQGSARINPEIGRDEREALLHGLPTIHGIAIEVLSSVTQRVGLGGAALYTSTLQQCLWVLHVDSADVALRAETYNYAKQVLRLFGLSMPTRFKEALSECISSCCEDIIPSPSLSIGGPSESQKAQKHAEPHSNGHHDLKRPFLGRLSKTGEAVSNANDLLSLACTNLPENYLGQPIRTQIDRAAILVQHETALLASALNPSTSQSMMPFSAREFAISTGTEALLRPRMPVVQRNSINDETTLYNDADADMRESNYAQLYSGNGTTNHSNEVVERRSFVEDSMESEKQPPQLSFASTDAQPAVPMENSTQRTEISLLEVPETQPITVVASKKRDHDAATGGTAPSESEPAGDDPKASPEDAPTPKRQRADNSEEIPTNPSNVGETGRRTEAQELTIPIQSVEPVQAPEEGSDSDDSSIHIDPTMSTDEEEEDDNEGL